MFWSLCVRKGVWHRLDVVGGILAARQAHDVRPQFVDLGQIEETGKHEISVRDERLDLCVGENAGDLNPRQIGGGDRGSVHDAKNGSESTVRQTGQGG
jgi:hypothetical protein